MARKDDIFKTFMDHPILIEKYNLQKSELPITVAAGINSEIPIIKSIALIVQSLESPNSINDTSLRNIVTSYLNSSI